VYRNCKCEDVCEKLVGKNLEFAGWVSSIRDHGGVKFIDLRDDSGILQIVAREEQLKDISKESSVHVEGILRKREENLVNKKIKTGEYEVEAKKIEVLGKCALLPFEVNDSRNVKEDLRLKYRFLDLRNEKNHKIIKLRSEILHFLRNKMHNLGFIEVQTPILSASSPEGARDYLVPSRKYKGKFYALPQAPQIFKQLLMVSGIDKYFQIAPCFRDEDSRADRAPGEFYQLDFEMAFAHQEDVFKAGEEILYSLFSEFSDKKITSVPFPRISYKESMEKYGTDKPDLRNKLIIVDLSSIFLGSGFSAFDGKTVKSITVPDAANCPRKFFDKMNRFAQEIGMQGLGYVKFDSNMVPSGPINKFIPDNLRREFLKLTDAKPNSSVFFISDEKSKVQKFAGEIRTKLAKELDLIDKNSFEFCYVTDFNMYEKDDDGKIIFTHNPFSMPQGGMESLENLDPLEILAHQYDIVCNGIELSSGAVRNHDPETLVKAFEIAGYSRNEVVEKFPSLYNALCYGAPPHAGMAPGLDRMIMLLSDSDNIREVVAFPMNGNAQDLLLGAPNFVSEEQLREIHIKIRD
jgi:aspartyl-tRNA synthetase